MTQAIKQREKNTQAAKANKCLAHKNYGVSNKQKKKVEIHPPHNFY